MNDTETTPESKLLLNKRICYLKSKFFLYELIPFKRRGAGLEEERERERVVELLPLEMNACNQM